MTTIREIYESNQKKIHAISNAGINKLYDHLDSPKGNMYGLSTSENVMLAEDLLEYKQVKSISACLQSHVDDQAKMVEKLEGRERELALSYLLGMNSMLIIIKQKENKTI